MAMILNGQVGWWSGTVNATPSTPALWTNIYAVYNADSVGSSSLKTSLYAAYNGESNANDSFGSNNGTAVGGLTYTTGKIGNAFTFNGTNAVVDFSDNIFNNLTGDFTVSMWVNLTSLVDRQGFFSNYKTYPSTSYEFKGFRIYYGPSGHPSNTGGVRVDIGDGTNPPVNLLTNNYLTTNTWYHIVVTRKFSTSTKIYINGVLSTSNSSTNNPALSLAYPSLGAVQYDSNLYTWYLSNNSKMDAVNIWQKELTQAEITELYNSGNGAQYITNDFYKPTTNDALNTYNGTAQGGLTYGVGKVGTAFQFNGSNAYVQLPNNSLNLTGSFSISFWVKLNNVATTYDYFVSNLNLVGSAYGYGFGVYREFTNWVFQINGGDKFIIYRHSSGSLNNNQWYHVAVCKSSTSTNMYINGTLVSTTKATVGPVPTPVETFNPTYTSNQPCYIGGVPGSIFSNGAMDAVNFWNKELSASEITELYNSGNGKQYPN
jgi:hypothetical protein